MVCGKKEHVLSLSSSLRGTQEKEREGETLRRCANGTSKSTPSRPCPASPRREKNVHNAGRAFANFYGRRCLIGGL
jgi:hypothetical protein